MAEAGPSELRTQAKVHEGQDGADRTDRSFSQRKNYFKDTRQGYSNRSSKSRPKKDKLGEGKGERSVCDLKSKIRTRKGWQHAKEQEKLESVFGEMEQSAHGLVGGSKADLNAREEIKGPVSTQQTSRHLKKNTKSQRNYQNQSGRGQRVANYSNSKSRCAGKHVDQPNISTASSQVPNLMAMDTQRPVQNYGIVSNGIYVPKNKLGNKTHGSQRKHFVSNDTFTNDNSLASTNWEGHSHSSRGKSGNSNNFGRHLNKKLPYHMGKLTAKFHAINLKSGSQSSVQAGVLIEQLSEEKYECMVCCEVIRCSKGIWSCSNCFHIFHLYCIKRWARSPAAAIEGERVFIFIPFFVDDMHILYI